MRILAVFEKGERIRHIGHLDIQRSVQRGLRRSGLPVAYSQGFNPHILITFASALSTGACGTREIMDVTMAEEVSADEFVARMNRAMPPEMQEAIPAMMAKDTIPAMRKTKTKLTEVDIKPLILSLRGEGNHLFTTLVLNERESCKPQMLLEALKAAAGIEGEVRMLVTRERLLGEDERGALAPLEML